MDIDVIQDRKRKNVIMVKYGILTQEQADTYVKLLTELTNVEVKIYEQEMMKVDRILDLMEPERKGLLIRLHFIEATQRVRLHGLSDERKNELIRESGEMFADEIIGTLLGDWTKRRGDGK